MECWEKFGRNVSKFSLLSGNLGYEFLDATESLVICLVSTIEQVETSKTVTQQVKPPITTSDLTSSSTSYLIASNSQAALLFDKNIPASSFLLYIDIG